MKIEEFIANAIEAYDPGDHPMAWRLREIVTEHRVLPLLFDMGSCAGIRADLTVWDVLWEDWGTLRISDGPRAVVDPVSRDISIAVGLKRYPELRVLLPERPLPAPICPVCDESGLGPDGVWCMGCGGLGWIPERWTESPHYRMDLSKLVWR